jgi:hypothetical protein
MTVYNMPLLDQIDYSQVVLLALRLPVHTAHDRRDIISYEPACLTFDL